MNGLRVLIGWCGWALAFLCLLVGLALTGERNRAVEREREREQEVRWTLIHPKWSECRIPNCQYVHDDDPEPSDQVEEFDNDDLINHLRAKPTRPNRLED